MKNLFLDLSVFEAALLFSLYVFIYLCGVRKLKSSLTITIAGALYLYKNIFIDFLKQFFRFRTHKINESGMFVSAPYKSPENSFVKKLMGNLIMFHRKDHLMFIAVIVFMSACLSFLIVFFFSIFRYLVVIAAIVLYYFNRNFFNLKNSKFSFLNNGDAFTSMDNDAIKVQSGADVSATSGLDSPAMLNFMILVGFIFIVFMLVYAIPKFLFSIVFSIYSSMGALIILKSGFNVKRNWENRDMLASFDNSGTGVASHTAPELGLDEFLQTNFYVLLGMIVGSFVMQNEFT